MKTYQERVLELENEGCSTSDAQGIADLEFKIEPEHDLDCECLECCTHEELDHGVCMYCGDDQSEWIGPEYEVNEER